jgi:Lon protease-like protein
MGRSGFEPAYDELPAVLPIFPLPGVLLLPGGRLPLNIFEPRYLAMTRAALAGARLIGMLQPRPDQGGVEPGSARPYPVGCAGRLVAFSETEDGRYLITLAGLIRFRVAAELPGAAEGFRLVRPDFAPFRDDLEGGEAALRLDRPRLLAALKRYFERQGMTADWDSVEKAADERLVTSLAMLCPFEASEKQALLEAPTLQQRAEAMIAILEMGAHGPGGEARPN